MTPTFVDSKYSLHHFQCRSWLKRSSRSYLDYYRQCSICYNEDQSWCQGCWTEKSVSTAAVSWSRVSLPCASWMQQCVCMRGCGCVCVCGHVGVCVGVWVYVWVWGCMCGCGGVYVCVWVLRYIRPGLGQFLV